MMNYSKSSQVLLIAVSLALLGCVEANAQSQVATDQLPQNVKKVEVRTVEPVRASDREQRKNEYLETHKGDVKVRTESQVKQRQARTALQAAPTRLSNEEREAVRNSRKAGADQPNVPK